MAACRNWIRLSASLLYREDQTQFDGRMPFAMLILLTVTVAGQGRVGLQIRTDAEDYADARRLRLRYSAAINAVRRAAAHGGYALAIVGLADAAMKERVWQGDGDYRPSIPRDRCSSAMPIYIAGSGDQAAAQLLVQDDLTFRAGRGVR